MKIADGEAKESVKLNEPMKTTDGEATESVRKRYVSESRASGERPGASDDFGDFWR